jgi:hypothetical protein
MTQATQPSRRCRSGCGIAAPVLSRLISNALHGQTHRLSFRLALHDEHAGEEVEVALCMTQSAPHLNGYWRGGGANVASTDSFSPTAWIGPHSA